MEQVRQRAIHTRARAAVKATESKKFHYKVGSKVSYFGYSLYFTIGMYVCVYEENTFASRQIADLHMFVCMCICWKLLNKFTDVYFSLLL